MGRRASLFCPFHSESFLTPSVFDVTYTPTADFVLSASDDGNVRIWKSSASQKLGPMSTKEKQSIEYRQKLVEQWSTSKEVRKVADRRHLPASVHNAVKLKREMIEAAKVKEDRRRKHSRKGKEKPKAERKSESWLLMWREIGARWLESMEAILVGWSPDAPHLWGRDDAERRGAVSLNPIRNRHFGFGMRCSCRDRCLQGHQLWLARFCDLDFGSPIFLACRV